MFGCAKNPSTGSKWAAAALSQTQAANQSEASFLQWATLGYGRHFGTALAAAAGTIVFPLYLALSPSTLAPQQASVRGIWADDPVSAC
ncbi:hypothetical protein ColLi_05203 [Colletotrichum liriopes]|uniref:Uncharacterized protein n=1 Tax=Colletotrichum liriopes TaxID=708192 RepID=A0AA37GKM4_9PEZI|nr:hypothetical protein ColLi_05203 [Colletotrichum liriopes]